MERLQMDDPNNTIQPPTLLDLSLSPAEATAKLAEAAAAYASAPPPAEPQTAVDARRRLDILISDKSWGERYLNRDPAALREIAALHERIAAGDPIADVLSGAVPPPGEFEVTTEDRLSRRNLAQTIQEYRDLGISDEASNEIIRGLPQSPENIAKTKIMLNQRQGDPEWVKRYLSGGMTERREMTLMCGIIAGEPA
jgi:hypothetical protein